MHFTGGRSWCKTRFSFNNRAENNTSSAFSHRVMKLSKSFPKKPHLLSLLRRWVYGIYRQSGICPYLQQWIKVILSLYKIFVAHIKLCESEMWKYCNSKFFNPNIQKYVERIQEYRYLDLLGQPSMCDQEFIDIRQIDAQLVVTVDRSLTNIHQPGIQLSTKNHVRCNISQNALTRIATLGTTSCRN